MTKRTSRRNKVDMQQKTSRRFKNGVSQSGEWLTGENIVGNRALKAEEGLRQTTKKKAEGVTKS